MIPEYSEYLVITGWIPTTCQALPGKRICWGVVGGRHTGGTGRKARGNALGRPRQGQRDYTSGRTGGREGSAREPASSHCLLTPGMSRTAASLHSNVNILNTAELYLKKKQTKIWELNLITREHPQNPDWWPFYEMTGLVPFKSVRVLRVQGRQRSCTKRKETQGIRQPLATHEPQRDPFTPKGAIGTNGELWMKSQDYTAVTLSVLMSWSR